MLLYAVSVIVRNGRGGRRKTQKHTRRVFVRDRFSVTHLPDIIKTGLVNALHVRRRAQARAMFARRALGYRVIHTRAFRRVFVGSL